MHSRLVVACGGRCLEKLIRSLKALMLTSSVNEISKHIRDELHWGERTNNEYQGQIQ